MSSSSSELMGAPPMNGIARKVYTLRTMDMVTVANLDFREYENGGINPYFVAWCDYYYCC
jgi:hypothetical protein